MDRHRLYGYRLPLSPISMGKNTVNNLFRPVSIKSQFQEKFPRHVRSQLRVAQYATCPVLGLPSYIMEHRGGLHNKQIRPFLFGDMAPETVYPLHMVPPVTCAKVFH